MSHVYRDPGNLIRHAIDIACESRSLSPRTRYARDKTIAAEKHAGENSRIDGRPPMQQILLLKLSRWLRKDTPANNRVRHGRAA